jgi:hypothetical protein
MSKGAATAVCALVCLVSAGCAQQEQPASADPLEPPVYYAGGAARPSTDEENRYADRNNLAVIRQYVATGQMPAEVQSPPGGAVGWLGESLGLRAKTLPVSPALKRRAILAKQQADDQRERCQAGDRAACHWQVNFDCRSGDVGACRTLCQLGDNAACVDYKRLLCEQSDHYLPCP